LALVKCQTSMNYFWIGILFWCLGRQSAFCQSLLSDSLEVQIVIPKTTAEQSQLQEALIKAQKALKQIEITGNPTRLLKSYVHLGDTYKQMGLYKQAIQSFETAFQIAKDHNIDEDASIIRQLILLHLADNNIIKALAYAEAEKELYEKRNTQHGLSTSLCVLGDIYIKVKKYKEASVVLNQAYQIAQKEENAELQWKAILNLAELHIQLQDGEHALLWLEKALPLAKSGNNSDDLVEYYLLQSKAYHLNKEIDKAVESASFALDKASVSQSKRLTSQAVLQLAYLYEWVGDYQAALRYYKIYVQIEGSLHTHDLYKNIEQLEIKFEAQTKDQKIEMLTKEADFARYQTIVGGLAFGIVLVLLFFSYNAYRGKKQSERQLITANIEMQMQNQEIRRQNALIASRNKVIAQTVQYAKRIQQYVYSGQPNYFKIFNRTFIHDMPVETISGDFYWTTYRTDSFILVFADCPEHDVAGAFNTVVISTLAAQVIQESNYRNPSEILEEIDIRMKKLQLPNERYSLNAGVKMGICTINVHNKRLIFAGAQMPLYYIHESQLRCITPNKRALGRQYNHKKPYFQNHILMLTPQDRLWFISDGYTSQFGGKIQPPTRIYPAQVRKFLQEIASLNLHQQGEQLIEHFKLWKGTNKQTDDVLLFGIEI